MADAPPTPPPGPPVLPGRDCGDCGRPSCAALAGEAAVNPALLARCPHLHPFATSAALPVPPAQPGDWRDALGREFELILEPFPTDPGPREVILPLNPARTAQLQVRQGEILYGRPVTMGCPVLHVGRIMAPPDPVNGILEWCVVGPALARQGGRELGPYTPLAYTGLVRHSRTPLRVGQRYFFLPRWCMLHARHSGVLSLLLEGREGSTVRLEGIWIG